MITHWKKFELCAYSGSNAHYILVQNNKFINLFLVMSLDTNIVSPASQNLSGATQQEEAAAEVAEAMEEGEFVCSDM